MKPSDLRDLARTVHMYRPLVSSVSELLGITCREADRVVATGNITIEAAGTYIFEARTNLLVNSLKLSWNKTEEEWEKI